MYNTCMFESNWKYVTTMVCQCRVGALLVHGFTTGKHELTRFITTWTWGSHHLAPYSVLYA